MRGMGSFLATDPQADELLHRLLATTEGQQDPYPLYRALRSMAPVHRSGLDGVWYTTGFAAARPVSPCTPPDAPAVPRRASPARRGRDGGRADP